MPTERRPSPTLLAASLVGVLGGALVAVPEAALAQQGRPSTLAMTCGQARNFLAARGAAVLGTGGYTYDRYVRDRSFCEPTEITKNAVVPTRDTPECLVGYRCIEPGRNWFDDE
ncbi:hypothetical protein mvi_29360 [Methylobacterium indicum]|uniref:Uncharacterized protein n=1 Tax=Methylobacterium indicum TaxID=1775910 RepID=A0A8H8WTZ2_9HYPH|nr:hypothetical protein mvi_29360 [Methylobacterium indicum]